MNDNQGTKNLAEIFFDTKFYDKKIEHVNKDKKIIFSYTFFYYSNWN